MPSTRMEGELGEEEGDDPFSGSGKPAADQPAHR